MGGLTKALAPKIALKKWSHNWYNQWENLCPNCFNLVNYPMSAAQPKSGRWHNCFLALCILDFRLWGNTHTHTRTHTQNVYLQRNMNTVVSEGHLCTHRSGWRTHWGVNGTTAMGTADNGKAWGSSQDQDLVQCHKVLGWGWDSGHLVATEMSQLSSYGSGKPWCEGEAPDQAACPGAQGGQWKSNGQKEGQRMWAF